MFDKLIEIISRFWKDLLPFVIVEQWNEAIHLRFGLFLRTLKPGIHFKIPLLDSIIHANKRPGLNINNFQKYFKFNTDALMKKQGAYLPKGQAWGLGLIGGLLVLFSLLRLSVSRQLYTIVQAFFNNRVFFTPLPNKLLTLNMCVFTCELSYFLFFL